MIDREYRTVTRWVGIWLAAFCGVGAACVFAIGWYQPEKRTTQDVLDIWYPASPQPPASPGYVRELVKCDECGGDGTVAYAADDPIVKLGQAKAGETFTCPMCAGEGDLILESQSKP